MPKSSPPSSPVPRGLELTHVPPHSLQPAPWNPRRISAKARARLREGIERFGFVQPLVARTEDRLLVGGHQRWDIAVELQLETVPVIFLPDLSDRQAKALAVLLNNKDAQGEWEVSSLTALLEELAESPMDALLQATGFDEASLEKLLGSGADADPSLTPLDIRPMPAMVWVVFGVPSTQYAAVADQVQALAGVPNAICEVVASDHAARAVGGARGR